MTGFSYRKASAPTDSRKPLLACAATHSAFIEFTERANRDFGIAVGRYVILPDHVHLFVASGQDFTLGRWIGMLKQYLSKSLPNELALRPVWQQVFFDHLLRSDESLSQKWDYVRENPVRAGFVKTAAEWPYQGEIVLIQR